MAFPNRLLADHEKLVFDLKPHWIELLYPIFWTVVLAIAAGLGQAVARHHPIPQKVVFVLALALWVWLAIIPFLRWIYTDFVLTSHRVIRRTGVLAKHSKEIPLERVNDVRFDQSVLERMVGAGTLVIESAGERGQETIDHVPRPEHVQLTIYKEMELNAGRLSSGHTGSPAPATRATGGSVPEQIEALARLKQEGAISEAEYEAKKAELLDRM